MGPHAASQVPLLHSNKLGAGMGAPLGVDGVSFVQALDQKPQKNQLGKVNEQANESGQSLNYLPGAC